MTEEGIEALRERLRSLADELADMAIEQISRAADRAAELAAEAAETAGAWGGAPPPDPDALDAERRLTRARRHVEKALHCLAPPRGQTPGDQ